MGAQVILLFLIIVFLMAMVVLYAVKVSLHFMYLRLKDKKAPGTMGDFFSRNFIHKNDPQRWKDAWLAFPLMFAIVADDNNADCNRMKLRIKKMNVLIYFVLGVILLLGVYASKAYPEGLF